jgi:hypothetical protein
VLVFEELSPATLRISRERDLQSSALTEGERKKLEGLRGEEEMPVGRPEKRVHKAKGPNPLSCKKKVVVRKKRSRR